MDTEHLTRIAGLDEKKYYVVPYENDGGRMDFREEDMQRMAGRPSFIQRVDEVAGAGPSATVMKQEEIVGSVGMVPFWDGMAEVWAVVSRHVMKAKVHFHKASANLMDHFVNKLQLNRVQAAVIADHPKALCWVMRLGFKPEGTMKKYGPNGNDYVMCSKIYGEE